MGEEHLAALPRTHLVAPSPSDMESLVQSRRVGADVEAQATVGPAADIRKTAILATVALAVVVVLMASTQGGPAYFVQLGEKSRALAYARQVLGDDVPTPLADGHDGESYWLLARDPTLSGGTALAARLDRPAYRAQRIGFPVLAAPWRLGGEHALLWGLVITNLVAVGVGTYLTGSIATRLGGPSKLGYAFAANPLVWLALLFDFSDAVALVGLVGAVWAVRRRQVGLGGVLGVLAALAKESSLLGLAGVALLSRGLSLRERAVLVVPGVVSAALWRLYVINQPGFGAGAQVQEFALAPFSGFVRAWRDGWSPTGAWVAAALSLSLIPIAAAVVVAWWRRRESIELCAALPYALFVPFLSAQVLDIPVNSMRAVGPALTLAAIALLVPRPRFP